MSECLARSAVRAAPQGPTHNSPPRLVCQSHDPRRTAAAPPPAAPGPWQATARRAPGPVRVDDRDVSAQQVIEQQVALVVVVRGAGEIEVALQAQLVACRRGLTAVV